MVLSNRSPDWWKTLRVRDELLQQQPWYPLHTLLALLTVAAAGCETIPPLGPAEALKQFIALAATATRRSVASARKG